LPASSKGPSGEFVDYVTGQLHPMSELHVDHVVSVNEIFEMEGFGRLSIDDQLQILDMPENLRFLEESLNESKKDASLIRWLSKEFKVGSKNLTTVERQTLADLENAARKALQQEISHRLAALERTRQLAVGGML
jgi:hypothetical protein